MSEMVSMTKKQPLPSRTLYWGSDSEEDEEEKPKRKVSISKIISTGLITPSTKVYAQLYLRWRPTQNHIRGGDLRNQISWRQPLSRESTFQVRFGAILIEYDQM
jgi:hypothetical protein